MSFYTEPTGYIKTILSDLQGAWECFREAIIKSAIFEEKDIQRLIFHVDEAMSWENVRDLDGMKKSLLLIRNIVIQLPVDGEIHFWLKEVERILKKVLSDISAGKKI